MSIIFSFVSRWRHCSCRNKKHLVAISGSTLMLTFLSLVSGQTSSSSLQSISEWKPAYLCPSRSPSDVSSGQLSVAESSPGPVYAELVPGLRHGLCHHHSAAAHCAAHFLLLRWEIISSLFQVKHLSISSKISHRQYIPQRDLQPKHQTITLDEKKKRLSKSVYAIGQ